MKNNIIIDFEFFSKFENNQLIENIPSQLILIENNQQKTYNFISDDKPSNICLNCMGLSIEKWEKSQKYSIEEIKKILIDLKNLNKIFFGFNLESDKKILKNILGEEYNNFSLNLIDIEPNLIALNYDYTMINGKSLDIILQKYFHKILKNLFKEKKIYFNSEIKIDSVINLKDIFSNGKTIMNMGRFKGESVKYIYDCQFSHIVGCGFGSGIYSEICNTIKYYYNNGNDKDEEDDE